MIPPAHDARREAASLRTMAHARAAPVVLPSLSACHGFCASAHRSPLPLRTVAIAQGPHRKYNALLAYTLAKTPARPHRRKLH
jgi:hypothetical protein